MNFKYSTRDPAPIIESLTDPYSNDINPLLTRFSSAQEEERDRRQISASFHWLLKGLRLSD